MFRRVMRQSKKATTLVELILAMALMAIFIAACSTLIYPVMSIYTHMNSQSRAQLVADTVVDSLRAECARTYITSNSDVWISQQSGASVMESFPNSAFDPGPVLVIRKSSEYCESLASNYAITGDLCNAIYNSEDTDDAVPLTGNITSRAIYKMFEPISSDTGATGQKSPEGYLHYGFFKLGSDSNGNSYPAELYDFTDPFMDATYGEYKVEFEFHDIKTVTTDNIPAYVLVDVKVYDDSGIVYTRSNVVLDFASRVLA